VARRRKMAKSVGNNWDAPSYAETAPQAMLLP
jgi:hypothetical protein